MLHAAALAIALRLGWSSASPWGWRFVALALGAMLSLRLVTAWRVLFANDPQVLDAHAEWTALAVSALMLTGLLLLGRLDSGRDRAEVARQEGEEFLRREIEELQSLHQPEAVEEPQDLPPSIAAEPAVSGAISPSEAVERALQERTEELARTNRELEQFVYVAAHDLREPLRMVASFTQLLARREVGQRDAEAEEYMGFVTDGVARMQAQLDGLLRLSRVGRGADFAPVDCSVILEECLPALELAIEAAGATVTWEELPTIRADSAQIAKVFQELIGNAIKFQSSARSAHVHVRATREPSASILHVRDNGIGIEPHHAARVFAIFQRLHGRDEYPGTGIGLALCKKIVERHGGSIWFESVPGEGTTFLFRIPDEPASAITLGIPASGN